MVREAQLQIGNSDWEVLVISRRLRCAERLH